MLGLGLILPARVMAQGAPTATPAAPTPTPAPGQPTGGLKENPYGFQFTIDEQQQYLEAIQDCSTPSLECLVRNVSRFTAIEWINEIAGPQNMCKVDPNSPDCVGTENSIPERTNSLNNPSNVASGAVGGIYNMISAMYTHPVANTKTYVADVLNSAHIAAPAYAQGLGFAALDPILALWKTFRNISYIFFVLIFVIIGFMIMFRQKMGNAAITAQQAIPNILIALLFVTFSYAIAGLLIDLMYLSMVLIIGVFGQTFPGSEGTVNILTFNIFNLIGVMFRGVTNIGNNINIIDGLLSGIAGSNALTRIVSMLGGLTLSLVLAIAVLIGSVKLFFELLRSYATVVLAVVTAPIMLMLGAIPGRNAFMPWVKTIAGNLLPFPTILMVLVMYYKFTDGTVREGGGFMPPFLLGSGQGGTIVAIMGLAIILAMPEIVKKVRDSVAPKGGFGEFVANEGLKGFRAGASGLAVASAAPTGLAGGVYGAAREFGLGKRKPWELGRAFIKGSTDANGVTRGGLGRWGQRGWDSGNKVRVVMDRIAERRLFSAEDTEKLLKRISEQGAKKPATNNPPPQTSE